MIKGIANFFSTPSRARTLVIIAFIILLLVLIYWWRASRKKRQQEKQFQNDYQTLTQGGGSGGGQKPTYLSTNYTQYADRIYAAGCSGAFCYGTDEEAIYEVFNKMQNDLDVLLLTKAFGLREPRGEWCTPLDDNCDYSLGEWLQTELDADEFKEINNILTKKGITYQL